MTLPDAHALYAVTEESWPPASIRRLGPWTIREGKGGGGRVSAATAESPATDADVDTAEAAIRALGQSPFFMIREGDGALDNQLAARGYRIVDPVNLYAAPARSIATKRPPPVTAFTIWPPLQIQRDIWAAGGIGPGRLAVMDRAPQPKTTLLGRLNDRPAATAYVGSAHGCAMIHALEVTASARRQGLARLITRAAAFWALDHGLETLSLVTTQANVAANGLYASLGMSVVGQYHYRMLPEDRRP